MGTTKVVFIVGETASGKSALALDIAERFNGEIICADSRTVYKGMDIGTAKPSLEEQSKIPHHLLDVVEPDGSFSAADFKQQANEAISRISSKGKLPIVVGGTGLYVDALLFDYSFSPRNAKRDAQNPRHLDRSVAVTKKQVRPNTLIIGLQTERDVLKQRVMKRVNGMIKVGLIEEVKNLVGTYGVECRALQAPGYRAISAYVRGDLTLDEAAELFVKNDLNLAKRQRTWFKRNKYIQWVDNPRKAVALVTTFLNK